MHFRNKITPYENKSLQGVVCETWLRGTKIYSKDAGFDEALGPIGNLLLEKRETGPHEKAIGEKIFEVLPN